MNRITGERAQYVIERARAVHETGHCIWIWRSGKTLFGNQFDYTKAAFHEVLIRPFDDSELTKANMNLLEGADGRVVTSRELDRLSVADFRDLPGATRTARRHAVKRAKELARCEVLCLIAGPLVEHYDMAREDCDANPGTFCWVTELDVGEENECAGDISKAFAVVQRDLCCGKGRRAHDYMDGAVDELEQSLRDDPRYWRTIDALARALQTKRRLDERQAVNIMRRAWGKEQG